MAEISIHKHEPFKSREFYIEHGWRAFGSCFHRHDNSTGKVQIVIRKQEVGESVKTQTNYTDNALEKANPDNILNYESDRAMFDELYRMALNEVTVKIGKLLKTESIAVSETGDITFTYKSKINYDMNIVGALGDCIEQYLAKSIVCSWWSQRNPNLWQSNYNALQNISTSLDNLVGWRERKMRRPIDPIF